MANVKLSSADAALLYKKAGLSPIPLRAKQKKPIHEEPRETRGAWDSHKGPWQQFYPDGDELQKYFEHDENIGLHLDGVIKDIDLDGKFTAPFAKILLPEAIAFGRAGKTTHILVKIEEETELYQLKLHEKEAETLYGKESIEQKLMLVELRGIKSQTMVPPSIHPSGEPLEWLTNEGCIEKNLTALNAKVYTAAEIRKIIGLIAVLSICAQCYPETNRNIYIGTVGGVLARAGLTEGPIAALLFEMARLGHDSDLTRAEFDAAHAAKRFMKLIEALKNPNGLKSKKRSENIPGVKALCGESGINCPDLIEKFRCWLDPDKNTTKISDATVLADTFIDECYPDETLIYAQQLFWRWNEGIWEKIKDAGNILSSEIDKYFRQNGQNLTPSLVEAIFKKLKWAVTKEVQMGLPHETIINVKNGELSCVKGSWILRPHEKEHYFIAQIPHSYKPLATCPNFEKMLADMFSISRFKDEVLSAKDAEEKIQTLLIGLGYSCMQSYRLNKAWFLYGPSGTNKSVICKTLARLVGEKNVSGVEVAHLENKNFSKINLFGKYANIEEELSAEGPWPDAQVKKLTGGSILNDSYKGLDAFDFRSFATLWWASNEVPTSKDVSEAVRDRLRFIECLKFYPVNERNYNFFEEKIEPELSGVLNLALEALAKVLTGEPIIDPISSLELKGVWKTETNTIEAFVEERCIFEPEALEFTQTFWDDYFGDGVSRGWAQRNNQKPFNRTNFGKRFLAIVERTKDVRKYKKNGTMVFEGVRLRQSIDTPPLFKDNVVALADKKFEEAKKRSTDFGVNY